MKCNICSLKQLAGSRPAGEQTEQQVPAAGRARDEFLSAGDR